MAERSALRIDRWTTHYLVPADHPDPVGLQYQLDHMAGHDLPGALAAGLAPILRLDDERIFHVRRLELPVTLNASWPPDQIGRAWSAAFSKALTNALSGRPNDDVVVFRDHAEYLGRFLVDLAEGRAWRRWYYGAFDGLKLLPVSAAMRTAVADNPERGLGALLQLSDAELGTVLAALTDRDAERLLESLAVQAGVSIVAALRLAIPNWKGHRHRSGRGALLALQVFILVSRDHTELAGDGLAQAARLLAEIDKLARSEPVRLSRMLAQIRARGPTTYGAGLHDVDGLPADILAGIEAALSHQGRDTSANDLAMPERVAWGGMFFLLPHLDELELDRWTESWAGLGGTSGTAMLRLLILAACGGPDHRNEILADPIARHLTGVDGWMTRSELLAWTSKLPAEIGSELMASLDSRWQRDRVRLTPATRLALVVTRRRGAPVAILLDLDDGVWRGAGRLRSGYLRCLLNRVPAISAALADLKPEQDLLVADGLLVRDVPVPPGVAVEMLGSHDLESRCASDEALSEGIARLGHVADDLSYLLPSGPMAPIDIAVAVAAQHVLRAFSRRLPGFARSSLPYLARNFLDVPATLTDDERRRVVRVGRPPLGLVLSVTGALRDSYRLSWLDDRPIEMFPEGDD